MAGSDCEKLGRSAQQRPLKMLGLDARSNGRPMFHTKQSFLRWLLVGWGFNNSCGIKMWMCLCLPPLLKIHGWNSKPNWLCSYVPVLVRTVALLACEPFLTAKRAWWIGIKPCLCRPGLQLRLGLSWHTFPSLRNSFDLPTLGDPSMWDQGETIIS